MLLKREKLSLCCKETESFNYVLYKTLNELAPEYLQCLFKERHVNDYNLRDLEGKTFAAPAKYYEMKLLL